MASATCALTPNVFQAMGIQGIGSRGVFNQPRFSALVRSSFPTRPDSTFIVPTQLLPAQRIVLDLLNVKYVVAQAPSAKERTELAAAGLVEVSTDGVFVIYCEPDLLAQSISGSPIQSRGRSLRMLSPRLPR